MSCACDERIFAHIKDLAEFVQRGVRRGGDDVTVWPPSSPPDSAEWWRDVAFTMSVHWLALSSERDRYRKALEEIATASRWEPSYFRMEVDARGDAKWTRVDETVEVAREALKEGA